MNKKEIDICICFYNTPLKYFKICLDSIKKQTNKNFNLILLNDGSTNSDLEEYLNNEILNKDNGFDIEYHKQENKGLFHSRIEIIKFAVSKYIYFLDSDDIMKPEAIDLMINEIYNNKYNYKEPDVISFICEETKNGVTEIIRNKEDSFIGIKTNNEFDFSILELFSSKTIYGYYCVMWDKLYKTSVLKNIYLKKLNNFFDDIGKIFNREDDTHNMIIFSFINSFISTTDVILTYRKDDDRHKDLDNEARVINLINYFLVHFKFKNTKYLWTNKSVTFINLLNEIIDRKVKTNKAIANYLIELYHLEEKIKSIYDNKNNSINEYFDFSTGKLILKNKNIL